MRLTQTTKAKTQVQVQLDNARQVLQEERHDRHEITTMAKTYEHEIEQLRDVLDDETLQKEELLKQVTNIFLKIK